MTSIFTTIGGSSTKKRIEEANSDLRYLALAPLPLSFSFCGKERQKEEEERMKGMEQ